MLPSATAAARAAGMSRDQQKAAQRVARIPVKDFEAAVESDNPPTVTDLAERGTKRHPKTSQSPMGEVRPPLGERRPPAKTSSFEPSFDSRSMQPCWGSVSFARWPQTA